MATTADMRAWLRAEGYEVGTKGGLKPELVAAYELAHPGQGPDYPDADFETAFAEPPPDLEPADEVAVPAETRPRRPAKSRPGLAFPNPFGKSSAKRSTGGRPKPKAKHPRVGTEDLISGVWGMLSRFTRPISPVRATCVPPHGCRSTSVSPSPIRISRSRPVPRGGATDIVRTSPGSASSTASSTHSIRTG